MRYYFQPKALTWTYVTNYKLNVRYCEDAAFAATGPCIFPKSDNWQYFFGFLNSVVAQLLANNVGGESITYEVGEVASIPLAISSQNEGKITAIVEDNVHLSKVDWDSFET